MSKPEHELEELFLLSRDRFEQVAYRILRNREDAEDALQDAFLSASRHFCRFEGRSSITTWLTRIVKNAALMTRRKRGRNKYLVTAHGFGESGEFVVDTLPDVRPSPEWACSRTEIYSLIDVLIEKMNPLLAEAVKMAYYDELTPTEASGILAVPVSTYKGRLLRGTRLLKHRVRRAKQRLTPKQGCRSPRQQTPFSDKRGGSLGAANWTN